jgi:hypothetical protein
MEGERIDVVRRANGCRPVLDGKLWGTRCTRNDGRGQLKRQASAVASGSPFASTICSLATTGDADRDADRDGDGDGDGDMGDTTGRLNPRRSRPPSLPLPTPPPPPPPPKLI